METIRVKEVYRLLGKASIIVPSDAALDFVVALLGHEHRLQSVFMVDSQQRYTGMVSRFDLLRWIRFQFPDEKQTPKPQMEGLSLLMDAKKAKDLELHDMRSFSVKESDSVESALDLMLEYKQDIIPVLGEDGKILGDLSLSEVLLKALELGIPKA